MSEVSADLVVIVRDLMAANRTMKRLFARYRSGELRFVDLEELIGDDEGSVLFRLKERCHALFRPGDPERAMSARSEALFDLVVGSLFHEAMTFRENFYQQEIYGPRVRALRSGSDTDADTLFREFEKLLATVRDRLAEGLRETETLMEQTVHQLRGLLAERSNNGFVVRYLIENAELVEEVFGIPLDSLLSEMEGSAATGFEVAGRSYLGSGFYAEAKRAFAAAIDRGGDASELERLSQYASGMEAYLNGNFAECVSKLSAWFDGRGENEARLVDIARVAVSKIDQLMEGPDRGRVSADAAALIERIGRTFSPGPLGTGGAPRPGPGA